MKSPSEEGTAEDGTTSDSFFREDNDQARRMAVEEGLTFVWSTMAEGVNDANRALHAYKGREEYRPMLRADGVPYPEDERDDEGQ